MKKQLTDLKVTVIDKRFFASEETVYRFDTGGTTPLMDLPIGSLIYTGKNIAGPAHGFSCAVCGIWKGVDEINEFKHLLLKHQSKEKKNVSLQ